MVSRWAKARKRLAAVNEMLLACGWTVDANGFWTEPEAQARTRQEAMWGHFYGNAPVARWSAIAAMVTYDEFTMKTAIPWTDIFPTAWFYKENRYFIIEMTSLDFSPTSPLELILKGGAEIHPAVHDMCENNNDVWVRILGARRGITAVNDKPDGLLLTFRTPQARAAFFLDSRFDEKWLDESCGS